MASNTVPANTGGAGLVYEEFPWGELIAGSKSQLQALGIGIDMPYPGEPGARARVVCTTDPRGLPVEIRPDLRDDARFECFIEFPDRPMPWAAEPEAYAPGVTLLREHWCDTYTGAGDALVAARLVREDQLPGAPGVGKSHVAILADGTMAPNGGRRLRLRASSEPGTKSVEPAGRSGFVLRVRISPEEASQRLADDNRRLEEWRRAVTAMPRPPRLQPMRLRLATSQPVTPHAGHGGSDAAQATVRPALVLVPRND